MTLCFKAFLSQVLDPVEAELWEDTFLDKIEVYPNRGLWRIFLSTTRMRAREDIEVIRKKLLSKMDFLDELEIQPSLLNSKENIKKFLVKYQDDLSSSLFSGAVTFQSIQWEINDGRLDMKTSDRSCYDYLIENQVCDKISAWVWEKCNLQVLVRALCNDPEPAVQEDKVSFIRQGPLNVLSIDPHPQSPAWHKKSKRENKSREILKNSQPSKISEVEEGSKGVVVEGEVWHKNIANLRDGRVAVSYYLTDYTDTIIIKTFLDGVQEDQLNIGDWIKVIGSARYDNFAREIVLYLNAYCRPEKPEKRDDSEEKRIELHAHTKMSSMDGLTETEELIKRAAQWGHPAIAITDHGCTQAFPDAYRFGSKYNIKIIYGVEGYLIEEDKKARPYHIVLLAVNAEGLRNLYHLVSISYLDYYYRQPKIPRSELEKYRQGLLLGTACEAGELFSALVQGAGDQELEEIAAFYDYLEIQPIANNAFLVRDGQVDNDDQLKALNRKILELGKKMGKPVVATGDVHFLDPHHEIYRRIIQAGQGYEDVEQQAPLYFKTTGEMLNLFSYLGEENARDVVVNNPAVLNNVIENIKPVPDGFYPPKIDSAEEEVIGLTWQEAHRRYGDNLPIVVEERINRELGSITKHGFSVLYLIAHKLVKKSNQDGYLVGSRGSVGSSVVAYFMGITEVNPLPPHYLCPDCEYTQFILDGSVGCGADLGTRECPHCGKIMLSDGFDIPFETFLGFEGDKVPDIDLNFSGDYQSRAHQYVEELFGSENVFRAGTISTIAEKTAYGFVKKYAEGAQLNIKNSEIERLVRGVSGVRRTTGQHPGGLIVVPRDRNILEFTPLQHPAENKESGVITTHFEYHAIGDQLVKLDILGHDDPTVIKELEDLTGIKASQISLSEKATMKIFSSVEPLGISPEDIGSTVGTFGIPEFGTRFVRQMLEATRPTTFAELVRISGLSHGTDVWLNNAQDLIANQVAQLSDVICTRDDIMIFLIQKDIEKRQAFKIMEKVRKGKGLTDEDVSLMREHQVPEWYINSCNKIKYMFPKAHAVAYVTMAFRIAYYKVYYPLPFYASFFSIRAEDFDAQTILEGYEAVRNRIKEIDRMGYSASQKDKKLVPILELAMEMNARGFKFYPVDIYRSTADKFVVDDNGLLMPFSALPNVGSSAAQGIEQARDEGVFVSIEDFQQRTHLNKTAMDVLRKNGCFSGLPETTQMSLFG